MSKTELLENSVAEFSQQPYFTKKHESNDSLLAYLEDCGSFNNSENNHEAKFFNMVTNICQDDVPDGDSSYSISEFKPSDDDLITGESNPNRIMPVNFLDDTELAIPSEVLMNEIQQLVEYYLSDEYLTGNSFLLKHIQNNRMGYVSLKLMASFKRLAGITDHKILAVAISRSENLQLNDNWSRVRRLIPIPAEILVGQKISSKNVALTSNKKLEWSADSAEPSPSILDQESRKVCGKNFVVIYNLPPVSSAPGSTPELSTPFGAVMDCLKPYFAHLLSVTIIRPKFPVPLRFKDWVTIQPEYRCGRIMAIAEFITCEAAEMMVEHLSNTQNDREKGILTVRLCNPKVRLNRKDEKHDHTPCYHLNIKTIRSNSSNCLSSDSIPYRDQIQDLGSPNSGNPTLGNKCSSFNALVTTNDDLYHKNSSNWNLNSSEPSFNNNKNSYVHYKNEIIQPNQEYYSPYPNGYYYYSPLHYYQQ